jgi:Uma2 family endonuclease
MTATYDDLLRLKLPEWLFAEIVNGELRVQRLPPPLGTVAVSAIEALVGTTMRKSWCIVLRVEVYLGNDVLVPDIVGWRRERLLDFPNLQGIDIAPDWVCEVMTRETKRVDRRIKPQIYARHGVPHLWLVDVDDRIVEVLELIGESYECVGRYTGATTAVAKPFEEVMLDTSYVWGDVSAPSSPTPLQHPSTQSPHRPSTPKDERRGPRSR